MAVWILIQFATAERERPRPALQPLVAAEDEPELEIDIELPPVDDSLLDELPTTRRAKALTSRGEDELDKRRWKRALGLFERALALEPDLPRAHRGRGIALARLRRFDDARLAYTRYIELAPAAPDAPDVRRLLGM